MNAPLNREEAILAVAQDVLADSDWTARVVLAALVAEQQLVDTQYRDHPAFTTLSQALAPKPTVHPSDAHLQDTQKIHGHTFVKVDGEDRWIARGLDGEQLYELSRQDYEGDDGTGDPALEDDWGIWDVAGDDWAHEPLETGFPDKKMAIDSFGRWLRTQQ